MVHTKRFSLRHGIEHAPGEPIIDDAPKRLRYFVLEYMQNNCYPHDVMAILGRVLCRPEMIAEHFASRSDCWGIVARRIDDAKWWEVFNIIEALYEVSSRDRKSEPFVQKLNFVFNEESIGWRMHRSGELERLLPEAVRVQVEEVFKELQVDRFSPAFAQVLSAHKAFNRTPRLDQDVCTNIFDALESVAKEVTGMPAATLGDVLKVVRQKQTFPARHDRAV